MSEQDFETSSAFRAQPTRMRFIKYIFTPNYLKPGPLGPHQGRGMVRLGGVPDIVYLRTVAAATLAPDRDLHDLL